VTGFFGPHESAWKLFFRINEIEGIKAIEGI
jgi:hypothetical protein